MNKILVIGGNGFIGKHIVDKLKKSGLEPIIGTRYKNENLPFDQINFDLFDKKTWKNLPKLDQVINLAWYTDHPYFWDSPKNLHYKNNHILLFQYLSDLNYKHAIITGSCAEYLCNENSKPTELGRAKLDLLNSLLDISSKLKIRLSWARLFFVYGHGEPSTKFLSMLRNKKIKKKSIREPDSVRDFVDVKIVAEYIHSLCVNFSEGINDIGSGYGIQIGDLINKSTIDEDMLRKYKKPPNKDEIIANMNWYNKSTMKFNKAGLVKSLKSHLN